MRYISQEEYAKRQRNKNFRTGITDRFTISQIENFLSKINKTDGCWIIKSKSTKGYRRFMQLLAHRVSYELFVGPVPDGLVLDHLCGNRFCVRPDHLEAVTEVENGRRVMVGASV